jgi:hypothetical protein
MKIVIGQVGSVGMWVVQIKVDHYGDIIIWKQGLLFLSLTQMTLAVFLEIYIITTQKGIYIRTFQTIQPNQPYSPRVEKAEIYE